MNAQQLQARTLAACFAPPVRRAAAHLRKGGLLVYPTEAVWGLGCALSNAEGCERVLELKRRDAGKGLILVAAHIAQFEPLLDGIGRARRAELNRAWPGPTTFLVETDAELPPAIRGGHSKVALRVSAHPVVRALCLLAGEPLVSTSANLSGGRSPRYSFQARQRFGTAVHYCPGQVDLGARPSRIQDLASGRVLRA